MQATPAVPATRTRPNSVLSFNPATRRTAPMSPAIPVAATILVARTPAMQATPAVPATRTRPNSVLSFNALSPAFGKMSLSCTDE